MEQEAQPPTGPEMAKPELRSGAPYRRPSELGLELSASFARETRSSPSLKILRFSKDVYAAYPITTPSDGVNDQQAFPRSVLRLKTC